MTTGDGNHRSVSQNNSLKRDYEIPWDLKKYNSDSLTTLNCSGSDLTMGYFANGRFYDPSPRQPVVNAEQQQEIYAPASSYSDRSNVPVLSTFAGGIPRAQSFSSTQSSASTKYDFQNYCYCPNFFCHLGLGKQCRPISGFELFAIGPATII